MFRYITFLFVLGVISSAYIGYMTWKMDSIGSDRFSGISLGVILWLIGSGIEANVPKDTIIDTLAIQVHFVGIILTSLFLFLFAVRYTTGFNFTNKQLAALLYIPLVNIGLIAINPWNPLVWTDIIQVEMFGLMYSKLVWGPFLVVHSVYSYGLIFASVVLFARLIVSNDQSFLQQSVFLSLGIVAPLLSSLIFTFSDYLIIDPTPLSLTMTQFFFLLALYRTDFYSVIPGISNLSWNHIANSIDVGVCITDAQGKIIEVNPKLLEMLGLEEHSQLIGEEVQEVFERIDGVRVNQSITIEKDGYYYRVSKDPTYDNNGNKVGYTYTMNDITEETQSNQQIQLLNRFLRHNLRNSLSIITLSVERFKEISPKTEKGENIVNLEVDRVQDQVDTLDSMGSSVKAAESALITDNYVTKNISEIINESINSVKQTHTTDFTINTDIEDDYSVRVVGRFNIALEHTIKNAIDHTDIDGLEIDISVWEETDQFIKIKVEDNGPGIPVDAINSFKNEIAVDPTTTNLEKDPLLHGTGIGFALIYLITTHSGGQLTIKSAEEVDHGVIELTIPKA